MIYFFKLLSQNASATPRFAQHDGADGIPTIIKIHHSVLIIHHLKGCYCYSPNTLHSVYIHLVWHPIQPVE